MKFVHRVASDNREEAQNLAYSRRNRPNLNNDQEGMRSVISSLNGLYNLCRAKKGDRKINANDRKAYCQHLNNIVTDLYAAWLVEPDLYVGYSRGKSNFLRGGCYWDFQE
jgi:hypothetical protein